MTQDKFITGDGVEVYQKSCAHWDVPVEEECLEVIRLQRRASLITEDELISWECAGETRIHIMLLDRGYLTGAQLSFFRRPILDAERKEEPNLESYSEMVVVGVGKKGLVYLPLQLGNM